MILEQRSEIEEFLLDAIRHVKQQIKKDLNFETRKTRFPDISSRPETGNKGLTQKIPEKTELSDLEWEDKEKILRILFSKINANMNSKKWREIVMSTDIANIVAGDEKKGAK